MEELSGCPHLGPPAPSLPSSGGGDCVQKLAPEAPLLVGRGKTRLGVAHGWAGSGWTGLAGWGNVAKKLPVLAKLCDGLPPCAEIPFP